MSIYYSNYLGAYLIVKNQSGVIEEEIKNCFQCNISYTDKPHVFCPQCGNTITLGTIEVPAVDKFQIDEDLDNQLYSPEYPNSEEEQYYFPNTRDPNISIDIGDPEECPMIEFVGNIDIQFFIDSFRAKYADIIRCIEENGFEYRICFGFVGKAS